MAFTIFHVRSTLTDTEQKKLTNQVRVVAWGGAAAATLIGIFAPFLFPLVVLFGLPSIYGFWYLLCCDHPHISSFAKAFIILPLILLILSCIACLILPVVL